MRLYEGFQLIRAGVPVSLTISQGSGMSASPIKIAGW